VVFLRAIPLYPSGHGRVDDAVARLQEALAAIDQTIRLEVHEGRLLLQGKPVDTKGAGRAGVRDALTATGVARVTFEREAPKASLVHFARILHRNQKAVREGGVTFDQLWSDPIEGVTLEERVYGVGSFADEEHLEELDEEAVRRFQTDDAGVTEAMGQGARPRRLRTVSRKLRRLVRDNERTKSLLDALEGRFQPAQEAYQVHERLDLLEYVLRLLPAEARRDPDAGMRIVERVLERFAAEMGEDRKSDPEECLKAALVRTVGGLFPSAAAPQGPAAPVEDLPPQTAEDVRRDRERHLEEDLDLVRDLAGPGDEAAPEFSSEVGVGETGPILIHSLVTATDATRRDLLKTRLVARLSENRQFGDVQSLTEHLNEAITAYTRDPVEAARLRVLAAVVAEAGLWDVAEEVGALKPAVVATTFPSLLGAYRAGGGKMGPICRLVGRAGILDAAAALLAPGGVLRGDGATKLLTDRSIDCLPMVEVLIRSGDAALRERAVRVVRSMDLPSAAAGALRALPASRVPDDLVCTVCDDAFAGVDSHRMDEQALALLADVALSPGQDVAARIFATAALGAFPRPLAEPWLRWVWSRRRRFFPLLRAYPNAVRRAAKTILDRYEAEAREAAEQAAKHVAAAVSPAALRRTP
jgi:hypothetical protein